MKKLFIALIFPVAIYGQDIDSVADYSHFQLPYSTYKFNALIDTSGLPESNKKIWEYCYARMGKRVGDGICMTLVDSAVEQVIPNWNSHFITDYDSEVRPGEIIMFEDVIIKTGFFRREKIMTSHIGIIFKVDANGDIYFFNQNVDVDDPKDSKVVITLDHLKVIRGRCTIGHPY